MVSIDLINWTYSWYIQYNRLSQSSQFVRANLRFPSIQSIEPIALDSFVKISGFPRIFLIEISYEINIDWLIETIYIFLKGTSRLKFWRGQRNPQAISSRTLTSLTCPTSEHGSLRGFGITFRPGREPLRSTWAFRLPGMNGTTRSLLENQPFTTSSSQWSGRLEVLRLVVFYLLHGGTPFIMQDNKGGYCVYCFLI